MMVGPGAGAEPTASSVVADVMDIARALDVPSSAPSPLGFLPEHLQDTQVLPIGDTVTANYLRIHAEDHPGVMNAITQILSDHGINIDAITQKAVRESDGFADIVILTQLIKESILNQALVKIEDLIDIQAPVTRIRVETMD
jgi:homoserine dehydrogenase